MMKKTALFAALLLVVGSIPSWATCPTDKWVDEKANSSSYPVKVGGMILRGLHRIVESPGELVYHTYQGIKTPEHGVGVLKGLGMGTAWMADGIVRGGWDILSALIPDYHGEPGTHHCEFGAEKAEK